LSITDIRASASSVPATDPRPPAKCPPPSSTAVSTVSSRPIAAVGSPTPNCEVFSSPASPAASPDVRYSRKIHRRPGCNSRRWSPASRPTIRERRPAPDLDSIPAPAARPAKINVGSAIPQNGSAFARLCKPGITTARPAGSRYASARTSAAVPIVAATLFTRPAVTSAALTSPMPRPVPIAAAIAAGSPISGAVIASTTPVSATPDPTEMSTWPAITRKVAGRATIPASASALSRSSRLVTVQKYGVVAAKYQQAPRVAAASTARVITMRRIGGRGGGLHHGPGQASWG
jgi:hypothetical protein